MRTFRKLCLFFIRNQVWWCLQSTY